MQRSTKWTITHISELTLCAWDIGEKECCLYGGKAMKPLNVLIRYHGLGHCTRRTKNRLLYWQQRAEERVCGLPGTSGMSFSISIWACQMLLCMQLPVENEESQMFMANSTCWLSSAFHIVVSFTFITCFATSGPLACELVSSRNLHF